jgi:hypothetical protein
MVPHVLARLAASLPAMTLVAIISCESTDRRLAEFAQRATEQQARQNERLAEQSTSIVKQSQEVAAAAHDLVEQDAAARRELLQAHDQWRQQTSAEQANLDQQRRQIDSERKAAAQAAVRDPIVGQAIITVGLALAALLPLVLTAYALCRMPERGVSDRLLDDLLMEELSSAAVGDCTSDVTVAGRRETRLARGKESMIAANQPPS